MSTGLAPVPTETSACAHCGASLVADQRYCLSCGQPCSPVRLAFLDVLDTERQPRPAQGLASATPVAYSPVEPVAGPAWVRRYAPMFGVLSVLLLAMIVGLLVGHWVTQSRSGSGPQVVKIEGLSDLPLASSSTASTSTAPTATGSSRSAASSNTPATTSSSKSAASSKSEEQQEQAEAKQEEAEEVKHPPKAPPAKTLSKSEATKLEKTTGHSKEAELNKITTAPIEVK